jgi:hypothetical protein
LWPSDDLIDRTVVDRFHFDGAHLRSLSRVALLLLGISIGSLEGNRVSTHRNVIETVWSPMITGRECDDFAFIGRNAHDLSKRRGVEFEGAQWNDRGGTKEPIGSATSSR